MGSVMGRPAGFGRNVMVDGRNRALRLAHAATGYSQSLEGLRGCDLVDQVQIDVKQRRSSGRNTDHVRIPDLVKQCELLSHGFGLIQSNSRAAVFQRAAELAAHSRTYYLLTGIHRLIAMIGFGPNHLR